MTRIPRSSLTIPASRQRGAPTPDAVAALADSIRENGLLHPPVVHHRQTGYELLAGHTRLLAIDLLAAEGDGFTYGGSYFPPGELPVTPLTELSPREAFQIELEENVRRTDLPWQRQTEAMAKLHALKLAEGLSHTAAVAATIAESERLGGPDRRPSEMHQDILLGQHLHDPQVASAPNRKEALKVIARKLRAESDRAVPRAAPPNVLLGDCLAILPTLPPASFDGILSDPPYGIGITQLSYQRTSEQEYDDSYQTWQRLVPNGLVPHLARILKPNAVGYLFCDFSRFAELAAAVERHGFEPYPRPLIWNRAPDGRLTTPEKWPRRCYECILYFRRGTRPLREARPDVLSHPADRLGDNYHGARKPVALFRDLLERAFSPGDRVLDPFAGSGPLLPAAAALNIEPLLIEKDPTYYSLLLRLRTDSDDTSTPL